MKSIIKSTTAIIAIAGLATSASAGSTSSTTYSDGLIQAVNNFLGAGTAGAIYGAEQAIGGSIQRNSGSVYHQDGATADNEDSASNNVVNTFTLKGNVTADCSFYGGGTTAHTIDVGTIGVYTGNNNNVTQAFNQRSDLTANVQSATAGCNTNNTVTIAKNALGMVNPVSGVSFDPNQFTANIPYTVSASWTGVARGGTPGTQNLAVAANAATNSLQQGAWRSQFSMNILAPAQTKGLVAGNYSDTITVTLTTL